MWNPSPPRQALMAGAALLLCSCASSHSIHTYADLRAEVARDTVSYQTSQLTAHPQKTLYTSNLIEDGFYQLPLDERVAYIADSFSKYDLDGEGGETMTAMLCSREKPKSGWFGPGYQSPADVAYMRAIFERLDGLTPAQLEAFCLPPGNEQHFRKNLAEWKKLCHYQPGR